MMTARWIPFTRKPKYSVGDEEHAHVEKQHGHHHHHHETKECFKGHKTDKLWGLPPSENQDNVWIECDVCGTDITHKLERGFRFCKECDFMLCHRCSTIDFHIGDRVELTKMRRHAGYNGTKGTVLGKMYEGKVLKRVEVEIDIPIEGEKVIPFNPKCVRRIKKHRRRSNSQTSISTSSNSTTSNSTVENSLSSSSNSSTPNVSPFFPSRQFDGHPDDALDRSPRHLTSFKYLSGVLTDNTRKQLEEIIKFCLSKGRVNAGSLTHYVFTNSDMSGVVVEGHAMTMSAGSVGAYWQGSTWSARYQIESTIYVFVCFGENKFDEE